MNFRSIRGVGCGVLVSLGAWAVTPSAGLAAAARGAGTESPKAEAPKSDAREAIGPASPAVAAEYVLQPFDVIKVEVFKEPTLERQVRIDQDSSIVLPLINRVVLAGKTVREAQEMIRALYDKDYLVNPQINLSVVEFSKRTVNVLGNVTNAGAILIPPDRQLTVLDAVAQAGGFIRLAERRKVKVTRTAPGGQTQTFELNVDDIQRSSTSEAWILRPGDVIYVPERLM